MINLTPHTVVIIQFDGEKTEIPSSGIARVSAEEIDTGMTIGGVPVIYQEFGEVTGLPSYQQGCPIIVSRMVAMACPDRFDLLVPSKLVRDENQQIIGCQALETLANRS